MIIMLGFIIWEKIESVQLTNLKLYGLNHLHVVLKFQSSMHRYTLLRIEHGTTTSEGSEELQDILETDKERRFQSSAETSYQTLAERWKEYSSLDPTTSADAVHNYHTYLAEQSFLPYLNEIGAIAQLSSDAEADIQMAATNLMQLLPNLMYSITDACLLEQRRSGKPLSADIQKIGLLCGRLRDNMAKVERDAEKIASTNELINQDPLLARVKELRSMISDMVEILESQLNPAENREANPAEFTLLSRRTLATASVYEDVVYRYLQDTFARRADELNMSAWVITIVALASTLIPVFLGLYLFGSVSNPIRMMAGIMEHAVLDTRIRLSRKDEIGRMATAFDRFLDTTKAALKEAAQSSHQAVIIAQKMTESSRTIADESLLQNKQSSASSASMDYLQTTVHLIAENALNARHLITDVERRVSIGQQTINHSIEGIRHRADIISVSSKKIEDLHIASRNIGKALHLIRIIAKQLNLLGINASIEASKAGKHGKGFDVVAEEIRALALRADKTTHDIDEIVKSIQINVNESVDLIHGVQSEAAASTGQMDELQKSLGNIATEFLAVTDHVHKIVDATSRHAAAANEVEERIRMIDHSSKRILQGTQEINSSTDYFLQVTRGLQEMLMPFKMNETEESQKTTPQPSNHSHSNATALSTKNDPPHQNAFDLKTNDLISNVN